MLVTSIVSESQARAPSKEQYIAAQTDSLSKR